MSGLFRVIAWLVVIGGAVSAIVYYAYADVWVVPTDDPRMLVSIEPTLRGGDVLLVERHGVPLLGSLVRCVDPDEPRRWVVGRAVGVGGTELHVTGQGFSTAGSRPTSSSPCEAVTLTNPADGQDVRLDCRNEEFAGTDYQALHRTEGAAAATSGSDLRVPPGRTFLMSDDRYLHLDSRDYGSLPEASCRHIVFRLWGGAGFTDASRRFNLIW